MNLDSTRTVRELATEVPNATRAFEKMGIDYCCGGSKSLSDACVHAHVSVDDVVRALEQANSLVPATDASRPDFSTGSLGQLVEHILTTHHAYVKSGFRVFTSSLIRSYRCMGKTIPNWVRSNRHFRRCPPNSSRT